jgi:hypothetical protein
MRINLTALFILISIYSSIAQINLENTYLVPPIGTFYYTDLGNNNFKYFYIDYSNNYFSLYNMYHSPFMLNIVPQVSIDSSHNTIGFITSTRYLTAILRLLKRSNDKQLVCNCSILCISH